MRCRNDWAVVHGSCSTNIDATAAKPLSFNAAYQAVLDGYLRHHSQRLFAEMAAEILEQEKFAFDADTMAQAIEFAGGGAS